MLTWDDSQAVFQRLSSDSSSASLTAYKRDANLGYKLLLASLGRPVTEKTKTAVTVASQQYYQCTSDVLFIKSVKVTIGSIDYPLQPIESQEEWDYLNNNSTKTGAIPSHFFIRPRFGLGGTEIGIYPIPSTAGYTITLISEVSDKDLARDKYTMGSVTVTEASVAVAGDGTTFTLPMEGRYFQVTSETGDAMWYRIASYTSGVAISLENVYEGETAGTQDYQICEAFNLPEEMQILPVYYALGFFFGVKGNIKQEAKYVGLFGAGLREGRLRYASKGRDNIIRRTKMGMWLGSKTYPSHFPESIT